MTRSVSSSDRPSWLKDVDWTRVASLHLRSKAVASGALAGLHRSPHHGDGIEFGGHRPYVPGDDLRWIDRRALLRHDKLIIRQFQTERNRTLLILIDATASMGFGSTLSEHPKLQFASLLAAAIARISLSDGDRVGLCWIGGKYDLRLRPSARKDMFDRCVLALAAQRAAGDATVRPSLVDTAFTVAAMERPDITVLLSDILDVSDDPSVHLGRFASRGRCLSVAQILDPQEELFPFDGPTRLASSEGNIVAEAHGVKARESYMRALRALRERWTDELKRVGSHLTTCSTADEPVSVVADIVRSLGRGTC